MAAGQTAWPHPARADTVSTHQPYSRMGVTYLHLLDKRGHIIFIALSLVTWVQPLLVWCLWQAAQIFGGKKSLWFLWYLSDVQKKPDF